MICCASVSKSKFHSDDRNQNLAVERESGERGRGKRRGDLDLGQGDEIKVLDRSGENLSTLLVRQYK